MQNIIDQEGNDDLTLRPPVMRSTTRLRRAVLLTCLLLVAATRLALFSFPSVGGARASKPTKLIILHYHKTGHELSGVLAVAGFHKPFLRYKSPKKNLQSVIDSQANRTEISLVDGIRLYITDWKFENSTRLAHFVRDPFDWSLSAYLYHSQVPVPMLESKWITKADKQPCLIRDSRFARNVLGIDLRPIAKLCQDLIPDGASLYAQLRKLSVSQGLRLEAARGLLGSRHGDLMKMAHNAWFFAERKPGTVSTYKLSQFTSSKQSFRRAVRRLCSFGENALNVDWSVSECVEASTKYGYVGGDKTVSRDSQHVTSSLLTNAARRDLKAILQSDEILGPALRAIQSLLQEEWRKSWNENK